MRTLCSGFKEYDRFSWKSLRSSWPWRLARSDTLFICFNDYLTTMRTSNVEASPVLQRGLWNSVQQVRSRGSSALGYGVNDRGFETRQGLGVFIFTTASRPAPGPTQPPIQWVPGALSLGVKRLGSEADHSPPFSAETKEWVELYIHSPNTPSWRGA
jgi:hypothetical protein